MNELPSGLTIKGREVELVPIIGTEVCIGDGKGGRLNKSGEWCDDTFNDADRWPTAAEAIEAACSVADLPEGWSLHKNGNGSAWVYVNANHESSKNFPTARAAYLEIQRAAAKITDAGGGTPAS